MITKKLCLNSGQIIPLTDRMTMMFEVEDLEVASPATVSRWEMVYMEPVALGFRWIFKSWFNTIPPPFKLSEKLAIKIKDYVNKYISTLLDFMRRNYPELVTTTNNNLCQSFCRILDWYFSNYYDNESHIITSEEIDEFEGTIECLLL